VKRRTNLLVKLKVMKETHRQWKQGRVSWEEYRDPARLCRDGVRKAKAQMEPNLAKNAKNEKKSYYRYVSQKRKVKESIPILMSKIGELVTTDEEDAEVLNNFFCLSFHSQPLFPHVLSGWTSRQGLEELSPSHW